MIATVAPGVYKLDDGRYRVVAHAGNSRVNQRRKEKRFPASTGMREMKGWQANVRAGFQRDGLRVQRDTLAADVPRFMRVMNQRLARPEHCEHEINAWLDRFGDRRRHMIETEDVRQQVIEWKAKDSRRARSTIVSQHSRSSTSCSTARRLTIPLLTRNECVSRKRNRTAGRLRRFNACSRRWRRA